MVNYIKPLMLMLLALYPISLLGAKDVVSPVVQVKTAQDLALKSLQASDKEAQQDSQKDEKFKPTEKISEDLSVSFPVDI